VDPSASLVSDRLKVLQIHPTRECNLQCVHCYSLSGPGERGGLDPEVLNEVLTDGAQEGYEVASFSGGEPLVYRPLVEILHLAKNLGFITTVTTNGTVVNSVLAGRLKEVVDLLAFSLDGVPESHNRIRASPTAFTRLARGVDCIREIGLPFGYIFTLTLENVHELDWVAQYASDTGASLLQIHPLEEVGRAEDQFPGREPDETENMFAFLQSARLQSLHDDIRIHLDIAVTAEIPPIERVSHPMTKPLADLVNPLVLEPDGVVVPLQYGFTRSLSICNVKEQGIEKAAADWKESKYELFYETMVDAKRSLLDDERTPQLVNWFGWVSQVSRQRFTEELNLKRLHR
jgi:MoaA/NifB/PqqE/SkfB family radical SAM enzyme